MLVMRNGNVEDELDYRIATVILGAACVGLVICAVRTHRENLALQVRVDGLSRELQQAIERLAKYESEPKSKALEKAINLLAAAGIPGLIFLAAIATSGFTGAAAITFALSTLGGPAGMVGGVGTLVTLGVIFAKYDVSEVTMAVVRRVLNTKSRVALLQDIDVLPRIVPQTIRAKAREMLDSASN